MFFLIYIVQIVYLSFELECQKNENKQKEAHFFQKRKQMHQGLLSQLDGSSVTFKDKVVGSNLTPLPE